MGLQKTFTCPGSNVTVTDAYHRIKVYHGDKSHTVFTVDIFNSQADRDNGMDPYSSMSHRHDPGIGSTKELIVYLYDYLKTLPEYAGAIDV